MLRPEADSHWKRRLKTIAKVEVRYNRLNRITQALTGVKKEKIAEQMENKKMENKKQNDVKIGGKFFWTADNRMTLIFRTKN